MRIIWDAKRRTWVVRTNDGRYVDEFRKLLDAENRVTRGDCPDEVAS